MTERGAALTSTTRRNSRASPPPPGRSGAARRPPFSASCAEPISARELRDGPRADEIAASRASFEKWRLLQRWTRHRPYRDRTRAKRSDVWREALDRFRPLRDCELIDWLALQVEVAANIENGAPDMRPRDPRPTWLATLEYVSNRKRKALAMLRWAQAAQEDVGPVGDAAPRPRPSVAPTALGRGAGGHEGVPWTPDNSG